MADIDKGLPNIKRPEDEVVTENFEEVDVAEELGKGPVEVTEDENFRSSIPRGVTRCNFVAFRVFE